MSVEELCLSFLTVNGT